MPCGATPILLTPIAKRKFNETGLVDTHKEFADIIRLTAKENNVDLIDTDKLSRGLLIRLGEEQSQLLYNHIAPEVHPNYPEGIADNTHFSEYGARIMVQLALAELRKLNLELTDRLVKR